MNNQLKENSTERVDVTPRLPNSITDATSRVGESLKETVTTNNLTEDEENFFDELQNPDAIKETAKKIISELCKRICDWENPSINLLNNVCLHITWIEGGMYPWYTKAVLGQLPDWKNIAGLFQFNSNNPYATVEEFRKKRKEYMNSKLNPMHSSPDDPIREEWLTNLKHKKEKKEAQSYNIKDATWNYINFPSFTRSEDIETTLPLLKQEDVCIACFQWWYREVTKNTKVPYFDMRGNQKLIEWLWIKKNWEISIQEKIWCIYNPRDDVSHICVFWNEPGGRSWGWNLCTMMVTIKGSVSQKDAIDLIEHLKKYNGLKFDVWNNYPVDANDTDRANIQQQVVDYFNNK